LSVIYLFNKNQMKTNDLLQHAFMPEVVLFSHVLSVIHLCIS
jgi:hypothetical protein